MNTYENQAGINITPTKMQIVELINRNEQYYLHNADEIFFNEPLDFLNDKETKIISLLQGAYNELLIKNPLKSSSVSFTLPLNLFHVMQVPYDNTLLNQDLIEEFRWEFCVLYPYLKPEELIIQYLEIEKNPLCEINTCISIAVNRKFPAALQTFCEQNRLRLRFFDNAHIASERALFLNNILNDKGVTLSCYFSANCLSIIISFNGKPVYFKVIQLKDAGEIIAALNKEINENKIIQITNKIINTAFITGEEISTGMIESINKNTGINFKLFDPFNAITPDETLQGNRYYSDRPNSFAPAAGIAYRLS